MVQTKVGGYWEQKKRWLLCKVWPFKTKERRQEEVSKVRACSQSSKDDRLSEAVAQGVGGKPTNVKTFTRKKKNMGGSAGENPMVKQAQRNYIGSYVSGDLGGVNVKNKSYAKYYSNPGFKMPKIS